MKLFEMFDKTQPGRETTTVWIVGDKVRPNWEAGDGVPMEIVDVTGDQITVKDDWGNTGKLKASDLVRADVNEAGFGRGRGKPLQKELIVYPNITFDRGQAVRLPVGMEVEFAQGGDDWRNNIAKITADNKVWFAWNDTYLKAIMTPRKVKEDGEETKPTLTHEEVADAWMKEFPNSSVAVGKAFGGGFTFKFRLAKDKSEVASQIMDNDPLNYTALLDENGNWKEWSSSMFVAPEEGSHNVYSSVKFRKKSAKNVTLAQIQKRFTQVKDFVTQNADKLHRIHFDIGEKLGTSVTEGGVIDYVGRKMGVKLTSGAPKASQAPSWATHVGQTPEGAYHWLSNETPVETDDSDEYFPLANKTKFTGYMGKRNKAGVVEPINMLGEDNAVSDIKSKDPRVAQMLKKARINYAGKADDDLSALVSMMGDEQKVQDKELDSLDHHNTDQDVEIDQEEHTNVDQEEEINDLQTRVARLEQKKGVAEAGIGKTIKKGMKSLKRGMQGWGGGEYDSPQGPGGMSRRVAGYSDDDLKGMAKFHKSMDTDQEHTPAGLNKKLVNRNLRKRGQRDFEKYMNEAEHSEAVTQVLMRLQAAGGSVYKKAVLQKGNETAMLAQNGHVRFAIFPDGSTKRAKKFIEFQRDGWEIEMNLEEEIVPYKDEGEYHDDETGQIFSKDEVEPDPDTGGMREKPYASEPTDDDESLEQWKDNYNKGYEDEPQALNPSKLAQAQGMFGDIAAGGGDPVDYLMTELGMDMDSINALAQDNGYDDAYEWAESYAQTESVISNFKKLNNR